MPHFAAACLIEIFLIDGQIAFSVSNICYTLSEERDPGENIDGGR